LDAGGWVEGSVFWLRRCGRFGVLEEGRQLGDELVRVFEDVAMAVSGEGCKLNDRILTASPGL